MITARFGQYFFFFFKHARRSLCRWGCSILSYKRIYPCIDLGAYPRRLYWIRKIYRRTSGLGKMVKQSPRINGDNNGREKSIDTYATTQPCSIKFKRKVGRKARRRRSRARTRQELYRHLYFFIFKHSLGGRRRWRRRRKIAEADFSICR